MTSLVYGVLHAVAARDLLDVLAEAQASAGMQVDHIYDFQGVDTRAVRFRDDGSQ